MLNRDKINFKSKNFGNKLYSGLGDYITRDITMKSLKKGALIGLTSLIMSYSASAGEIISREKIEELKSNNSVNLTYSKGSKATTPIYLETWGDNNYNDDQTVGTFRRAVEVANSFSQPAIIYAGIGTFSDTVTGFPTIIVPNVELNVVGSGTDGLGNYLTTLDTTIAALYQPLNISNLSSNGKSTLDFEGFAVLDIGGTIDNCYFSNYGAVQVTPVIQSYLTNSTFENMLASNSVYIISLLNKVDLPPIITDNIFRNIPTTVFYLSHHVDAGNASGIGNNVFEDCVTVINNDLAGAILNFQGNAWITNAKNAKGAKVLTYHTLPADILSNFVVDNAGAALIDVTNALGYNPQTDEDSDGLIGSLEATIGTNPLVSDSDSDGLIDGAEVNSYNTDPLDSDSDDDTYLDGNEVSYGSNPNDNTSYPGSNPSVPINRYGQGLETLMLIGVGLGAMKLRRRKAKSFPS